MAAGDDHSPAPVLTRRATVHTLDYGGRRQRCWDFASAAQAGAAPVIFMVHGFRGDHHGLLRIAEELPDHRVLIPDLPGFGQSAELAGTHDVGSYAGFVAHSVRAFGLPPSTVLLGHSFGSVIASRAAADHPELFTALVLVNPICEPALEGSSRTASALAAAYYRAAGALPERAGLALLGNRLIVRAMSSFMARTREPALRRYIHREHRLHFSTFASRRAVLEAFRASVTGTVRDDAARLALPTLLIAAERDDLGSVEGQRRLAGMMPVAQLEILTAVGHLVHYEKPAEAAARITAFLGGRTA